MAKVVCSSECGHMSVALVTAYFLQVGTTASGLETDLALWSEGGVK